MKDLIAFATCGLKPDLTLLFDVDVEEGLRRKVQGGEWNRLDAYQVDFHNRVRQGYYRLVEEEPDRWVIIDANRDAQTVQEAARKVILGRLQKV